MSTKTVVPAAMISTGNVSAPQPGLPKRMWQATTRQLKALTTTLFSRQSWRLFTSPRSDYDFYGQVGDGTGSSTVTAPLFWIARTFPEAPPALWADLPNGQEERILRHPLLDLLMRPNGFYHGPQLWAASVIDYTVDGNAYWIKARNRSGAVKELWWAPHWTISPKTDDNKPREFIDHYEYRPGVDSIKLPVEDVVHFRFGLDPEDPRLGRSPLRSILREVFTDDEAAAFTASLLRNMGVPGIMVSPAPGVKISEDTALKTKADLLEKFTGDKRGEPIVMTGATTIEQFGFSPEQLLLRELRRIPEERVTAVLGIPAIVAGLGAGLDRSTFTNMGEAREAAYESGIIPTQRNISEDVRFQLLPDFSVDPYTHRFGFDLGKVRVLQEDQTRLAERHIKLVNGGLETRAEGRRATGLEVDEQRDNVFLLPANFTIVSADSGEITPLTTPTSSNGNGNGTAAAAVTA